MDTNTMPLTLEENTSDRHPAYSREEKAAFNTGAYLQRQDIKTWLPTHDSEVASKAKRELALNLVHEIEVGHFDNDSGDVLEPELINHIRALAEGKE